MTAADLDSKLNEVFLGKVVRKDLLLHVKKGTNVPSFVLEFLLARYCASDDPREIQEGMAAVLETIQKNYVRPDESNKAQMLVLLSFGIASFIGTSLSSVLLKRSVKAALAIAPLVLTACAVALVLWGESKIIASTVAIIWGFAFALIPVGWSTWITRSLSDQAEKAGSIQVAVIQLANTCGAAVGGIALDHLGLLSPLVLSGVLMLFTGLLVAAKVKVNSPA